MLRGSSLVCASNHLELKLSGVPLRSRDHAEAVKESARTQPYCVLLGALKPDCL